MRKHFLFLLTVLVTPFLSHGQARNPEVLIYGDGIDAYSAAIQSAKSNLHTIWVLESQDLSTSMALTTGSILSHQDLDGGIWADLLADVAKSQFNPQLVLNAMEQEIRQYPHLHLHYNLTIRSISKKSRWNIQLNNGLRLRVRSVVDATTTGQLAKMAKLGEMEYRTLDSAWQYSKLSPQIRTSVAVSDLQHHHAYSLPLAAFLPEGDHNILLTKHNPFLANLLTGTIDDLPLLSHTGQAVGAMAAYLAFFKTTTDKIDVRQVQGELLQYGARLIPYQDIQHSDPNFKAIQRIGVTNLFDYKLDSTGRVLFAPELPVSTQEISPVLNALYSRSQIWFTDNRSDSLSLSELLNLIKYIGQRGNELEGQVERLWSRNFSFTEPFDLTMTVNRRHVAVLLDELTKPFDVRVDLQGQVLR